MLDAESRLDYDIKVSFGATFSLVNVEDLNKKHVV